jgi:HSP20 family molecular chaperone IbpA
MYRRPDATDWMWAHACALVEEAEHLHRQFFRLAASARTEALWEPPADVFESELETVVVVALPGVAAERVQVTHDGDTLVVRAERPLPFAGGRHAIRQLEIPYGVFERRISLPGARLAADAPELTHGCLVVRLRRIA